MPQLIVRKVEEKLVRKLEEQAGLEGISVEEQHRRILRSALLGTPRNRPAFKDFLRRMPNLGPDELFERVASPDRKVVL